MTLFIRTFAIAILTISAVTQTPAGPKTGGKPSPSKTVPVAKTTSFAKTTTTKISATPAKAKIPAQAVKFASGYFYKGKNHHHWGLVRWDLRYGCYCYWDPCVLRWYYWCEQDDCYYPVSYCPYRTYCNVGVAEVATPAALPVDGASGTTIPPDAHSPAPLSSDIPPIPEPVSPRK